MQIWVRELPPPKSGEQRESPWKEAECAAYFDFSRRRVEAGKKLCRSERENNRGVVGTDSCGHKARRTMILL
jgi:hypothetical protein